MKIYNITPVAKPRMTQSDKWKKRPRVLKYYAFKDEIRQAKITLPVCNFHVIFILPMPKSWPKKKKMRFFNAPHKQTPDLDNLIKALKDAVLVSDAHIWDYRATKRWGNEGMIIINPID